MDRYKKGFDIRKVIMTLKNIKFWLFQKVEKSHNKIVKFAVK